MPSKKQTSTQKMEPWGPSQPYLQGILGEASNLYKNGQAGIPEQSVDTLKSYDMVRDRVEAGSPVLDTANSATMGILNSDPYKGTQDVFNNVFGQVAPAVNAQFSSAGRTGGGLHQDTMTRAATEAFSPYALSLYQGDQANKLAAASMAPSLNAAGYQGAQMLAGIGAQQDVHNQESSQWGSLNNYTNLVSQIGGMGGTNTATAPGQSPFQTAAGGAMTGMALGGPMGAAVGGGLGLLGGLF